MITGNKTIFKSMWRFWAPVLLLALLQVSCKKDWLSTKSDNTLVVPTTLNDFQGLLDNSFGVFNIHQSTVPEIGAGDVFIADGSWPKIQTNTEKNAYRWLPDVYAG